MNTHTNISSMEHNLHNESMHTTLWMSVINQALIDAVSNSVNAKARQHKKQAIKWLLSLDSTFEEVCQLAGINAHKLRIHIGRILLNNPSTRKLAIVVVSPAMYSKIKGFPVSSIKKFDLEFILYHSKRPLLP